MTDLALLQRWIRNRDTAAFNEIVERYASTVFATCARILGSAAEAEDVAQECFETLATAKKGPSENVGAWLHRVATHKSINRIRSESRRKHREVRYASNQVQTSELVWDDIYPHVDEAIAALPETIRAPLVAHYLQRKSHRQIAKELGVSRRTVSHRIGRGVELIGESLNRKGIAIPVSVLSGVLSSQLGSATPVSAGLAASLGKLALAQAGGSWTVQTTSTAAALGGLLVMKKIAITTAVAALVLGAWVLVRQSAPPEPSDIPVLAPEELPADFESVAALAEEESAPQLDTSTEAPVETAIAAKGSISGYVVDIAGQWLANCRVTGHLLQEGTRKTTETQTLTDANGRFTLAGLDAGNYEIYLQPEGIDVGHVGPQAIGIALGKRERRSGVRLVWHEGLAVWGRVTDVANRPLAEVDIHMWIRNSIDLVEATRRNFWAKTDAQGQYYVAGFPSDADIVLSISALHDHYVGGTRNPVTPGTEQNFILGRKNQFEGHVIDAATGRPITRYAILAYPLDEYFDANLDYWEKSGLGRGSRDVRDPEGRFHVDNESFAEDMAVVAIADGYALGYEVLEGVVSGEHVGNITVKLYRQASGDVYGIVVDSAGVPVSDAWVMRGYPDIEIARPDTRSGPDGRFRLESIPSHENLISAWHRSYNYAPGWTRIAHGGSSAEAPYRIVLSQGGAVSGQITVDGVPVGARGASVDFDFPDRRSHPIRPNENWTDGGGRFSIQPFAAGTILARALLTDQGRWLMRDIHVVEGQTTHVHFDFVVQDHDAAVEGTVTVGDTAPAAASVRVTATLPGGDQALFTARADELGNFHFDRLPVGVLDCEISAQDASGTWLPRKAYTVETRSGESVALVVDMLEAADAVD